MPLVRMPPLERNGHLDKLEEHFGRIERQLADLPADLNFVFLCFTNRCGSNFLAELLASSGQFNKAGEILNWPGVTDVARRRNHSRFQEYFAQLVAREQKSGFFFMKTALQHLEILAKAGILDQVHERAKFVLIERNDTLAQAISHAIAFATGAFTSEVKTAVAANEVEYSRAAVDKAMKSIAVARKNFSLFFGRNGIVPARVVYERVVEAPAREAMLLASELSLPHFSLKRSNLRLARQSGPVNEEWRRRYLSERD